MYTELTEESTGPEVTRLAAMAAKYKVFLVMGVIEREGYTLYCSVLFFDPLGRYLGKHRKLMPTALERIIWGFGDGSTIPVYDTPLGKIGALICWENKMPLLRTALYGKGKSSSYVDKFSWQLPFMGWKFWIEMEINFQFKSDKQLLKRHWHQNMYWVPWLM
jgi:hypothetical protein